ncbi:MAG TPA: SDR family oxidoreductase [Candidatus Melainabacteria bacterium]|nr:SDR family oxidoreductase [Candidatus Melainabacteria bacterium]HMP50001.1 SDR family oxidoreductase [Candidatus Melainabacteria bacterium]
MNQGLKDLTKLFSLDEKVVVLTGGGGILGRHFASALVQFGATVVVADLNFESAAAVCQEILNDFSLEAHPFELDVSSEASVKSLMEFVVDKFGRLDVLHNNAASKSSDLKRFFANTEDYDMDIWHEVMEVNLKGMFLMARAAGALMARQETGGSIIQTASIYGILSPDQRIYEGAEYMGVQINNPAVYSISKAGVVGLTRHLSTQWLGSKVRVNTITPGGVESGQNDTFKKNYSNRVPMGRMADANEMVGALIYLASDASTYVTGQNVIVDGGLSAW